MNSTKCEISLNTLCSTAFGLRKSSAARLLIWKYFTVGQAVNDGYEDKIKWHNWTILHQTALNPLQAERHNNMSHWNQNAYNSVVKIVVFILIFKEKKSVISTLLPLIDIWMKNTESKGRCNDPVFNLFFPCRAYWCEKVDVHGVWQADKAETTWTKVFAICRPVVWLELVEEISVAIQSLLVSAVLPTEHRHLISAFDTEKTNCKWKMQWMDVTKCSNFMSFWV